jgi:hypothetical protein
LSLQPKVTISDAAIEASRPINIAGPMSLRAGNDRRQRHPDWHQRGRGVLMATAKAVWGIDIGQCAVKALKLRQGEEGVVAEVFDMVEHAQILSEEDADKHLLIRAALDQLVSRNSFKGARVVVSVPGQASFTR